MLELLRDPEITSPEVRNRPAGPAQAEGFGHTEAPRGTLLHHYSSDPRGVVTRVNLIVGTTHNHAPIALSLKRAAQRLIQGGRVLEQGVLNRIEMAFRLYDPCLSCATHALGQMPLEVLLRAADGSVLRTWSQEVAP